MTSISKVSSEEMFQCSICLELFDEPVTTPCGHNFCDWCLDEAWATNESCTCPMCNRKYDRRPEISINYLLLEMVTQFKLEAEKLKSNLSKPGEVSCDLCSEPKLKAMKSCLVCLSSFCETHLQPHLTVSGLKRHQLMEPVENLEDWMCTRYHELLSLEEACERRRPSLLHMVEFKQLPSRLELLRVQQFAVDITLDPDTAQICLILSEDLKQVHNADVEKKLPDSPLRFHPCACILAKQSFSSGRFYFEVQVTGKTEWDLGVARESINRKKEIALNPKNGFWRIGLRHKDVYWACAAPTVPLSLLRAPQKVGVFVDYGEGLVSFYDADSADLLFSFSNCCFKEKLFPFFSPSLNNGGSNSAPLVLPAVETFRDENDKV